MTVAQMAAREQVKRVDLDDIGRSLNMVAERLVALWDGDAEAAKSSLRELPLNGRLRHMLCLAVDTITRRRQRQVNRELGGWRIRRGRWH